MERPREFRLKHLVDLYGSADPLELEQAIRRLQKRLGGQRMNECLYELKQGALQRTAALLLDYYDKSYELSMKERDPELGTALEFKKEKPPGDRTKAERPKLMETIRLTQFSTGAGCGCKIAPDVLETILQKRKKVNIHVP